MPFLVSATSINSPDDFLPLRIFVGTITAVGVALILLLPVLCLRWVNDKILFWRRPGLIRKAAPLLGAEAVTHFPGPLSLRLTIGGDESPLMLGRTHNVLRFAPSRYLFDYEWFQSVFRAGDLKLGGKGTRRAVHTVAAFGMGPGLLPFQLRPRKSFFPWLGKVSLLDFLTPGELRPCRVEFASSPEFSRRYVVSSITIHAEAVREFFTPDVLNFFEQLDARPKWRVDACPGWLFVRSGGTVFGRRLPFRRRYLVAPGKLSAFIEQARAIAQQLEQHGRFLSPDAETQSEAKDS